jgi:hypothetical protein
MDRISIAPISMKKFALVLSAFLVIHYSEAQIGINNPNPDPSAMLDISATDKGLLIPRLTKIQRQGISSPATGLLVYQTDDVTGFWYYTSASGWTFLNPENDNLGNHTATQNLNLADKVLVGQTTAASAVGTTGLTIDSDGKVNIGTVRTNAAHAGLEVNSDAGIVATGTYQGYSASIAIEGSGTRMYWYPGKASFRAGHVDGTQWDDANIGLYSSAMGYNARASGDYAYCFGANSVAANTNSFAAGVYNTASGAASVALGYYAHTNARQGSFVFSDRSVVDDGNFMTDESFKASTNHTFNVRCIGGFRFFTSSNLSTGLTMAAGGNAWDVVSDSTRKEKVRLANGDEFLRKISTMRLGSWNYKGQSPDTMRHYGPMAQDFHAAFGHDGIGRIGNSTTINQADFDGVNLIAIQALEKRTSDLKKENDELKARISELENGKNKTAALKKENKLLKARFGKMEQEVAEIKAMLQSPGNPTSQPVTSR